MSIVVSTLDRISLESFSLTKIKEVAGKLVKLSLLSCRTALARVVERGGETGPVDSRTGVGGAASILHTYTTLSHTSHHTTLPP